MSYKDQENPNAFPGTDSIGQTSIGMSLRDYFAGQCIVGMACRVGNEAWRSELSRRAYELADAMLAERKKDNG
jgi:hypothetical protein